MATDYEKLYRTSADALGQPTRAFVDFFDTYPGTAANVLDVGCGQGRDAIFIARLGHRVTGVDISPAGISAMLATSAAETLNITGIVADIRDYQPDDLYDVMVIDRTLHMLNETDRLSVLSTLVQHVAEPGYLLIADEKSNIEGFRSLLDATRSGWTPVLEKGGYLFVTRTVGTR